MLLREAYGKRKCHFNAGCVVFKGCEDGIVRILAKDGDFSVLFQFSRGQRGDISLQIIDLNSERFAVHVAELDPYGIILRVGKTGYIMDIPPIIPGLLNPVTEIALYRAWTAKILVRGIYI